MIYRKGSTSMYGIGMAVTNDRTDADKEECMGVSPQLTTMRPSSVLQVKCFSRILYELSGDSELWLGNLFPSDSSFHSPAKHLFWQIRTEHNNPAERFAHRERMDYSSRFRCLKFLISLWIYARIRTRLVYDENLSNINDPISFATEIALQCTCFR